MDSFEQLGLLAEVAATFMGFIAVFVAFSRGDGRFSAADGHFIQAMVLSCMATLLFALGPRAHSLIVSLPEVWCAWSWIGVAVWGAMGLYIGWRQLHMPGSEAAAIHAFWHVPGWSLGVLGTACVLIAAADLGPREGFYVTSVTLALANGVWCFIAIVFRRFL